MVSFLENSVFFSVFLSLSFYGIGVLLKRKFKLAVFNPLLVCVFLIIAFLLIFDIDYQKYKEGAEYISYFLTPATVCLAVPLYEQFSTLKKNAKAVLAGIISGVIASAVTIFVLALLFKMDNEMYVTLLPKSITTAIAMPLSEELGGYVPLTVASILITGVLGNVVAVGVCKLFRITEPVAKGVAIGTASHAMGTTKAMEIGEVEGAMSSLSIVVAGLLTVVSVGIFAQLI